MKKIFNFWNFFITCHSRDHTLIQSISLIAPLLDRFSERKNSFPKLSVFLLDSNPQSWNFKISQITNLLSFGSDSCTKLKGRTLGSFLLYGLKVSVFKVLFLNSVDPLWSFWSQGQNFKNFIFFEVISDLKGREVNREMIQPTCSSDHYLSKSRDPNVFKKLSLRENAAKKKRVRFC